MKNYFNKLIVSLLVGWIPSIFIEHIETNYTNILYLFFIILFLYSLYINIKLGLENSSLVYQNDRLEKNNTHLENRNKELKNLVDNIKEKTEQKVVDPVVAQIAKAITKYGNRK